MTKILLIGAGKLGSAILSGWEAAGSVAAGDLTLVEPNLSAAVSRWAARGARVNPDASAYGEAEIVLIAVKPQVWRAAATPVQPHLSSDVKVVSVMAGVGLADLEGVFGEGRVARVMPTTAVATRSGAASIFGPPEPAAAAETLFAPIATVVPLDSDDALHAVTAVSGSGPAYVYAFLIALSRAGVAAGLNENVAQHLAQLTLAGAVAHLQSSGRDPEDLIREVASPKGTTEAALNVLRGGDALDLLVKTAVEAAAQRSRELAAGA